jgi:hypothetical protein
VVPLLTRSSARVCMMAPTARTRWPPGIPSFESHVLSPLAHACRTGPPPGAAGSAGPPAGPGHNRHGVSLAGSPAVEWHPARRPPPCPASECYCVPGISLASCQPEGRLTVTVKESDSDSDTKARRSHRVRLPATESDTLASWQAPSQPECGLCHGSPMIMIES